MVYGPVSRRQSEVSSVFLKVFFILYKFTFGADCSLLNMKITAKTTINAFKSEGSFKNFLQSKVNKK